MKRFAVNNSCTVFAEDIEQAKFFFKNKFQNVQIINIIEQDISKIFSYLPVDEIFEEDRQFIYDYKPGLGLASLPISLIYSKYKNDESKVGEIKEWYA